MKIRGALKKRFQTPLDLNLLLFRLSRACKWAIWPTLDSHIPMTLDFFNMLLGFLKEKSPAQQMKGKEKHSGGG
jgi:hypothetical protein